MNPMAAVAAVAGVALLGAMLFRRRRPDLGIGWVLAPGLIFALTGDALLPRTPRVLLITAFVVAGVALAVCVWLFIYTYRHPHARPGWLAWPLLALLGPLTATEVLPTGVTWHALIVALAGAAVLWDGLREWRTHAQPLGLRFVGLGAAAIWYGLLMAPPGPAPHWLLPALLFGFLLAGSVALRGYLLSTP